jgi:hypothetical protein
MERDKKLRDMSEIWEVYCDVEQAIEVSKFLFGLHARLGNIRALSASVKNDPTTIPLNDLIAKFRFVDSALESAIKEYNIGNGEAAIELARRARDQLKNLLLGKKKAEVSRLRK